MTKGADCGNDKGAVRLGRGGMTKGQTAGNDKGQTAENDRSGSCFFFLSPLWERVG